MEHTPHTVSDVMTQTVVAIGQEAPFKEIVRTMEQWKVSALPVLAGRAVWSEWSPKPTCCRRKNSGSRSQTVWSNCTGWTMCARPVH